jgi:hypothetical protein
MVIAKTAEPIKYLAGIIGTTKPMKTQEKIDLYRLHKNDYAAPKKPVLLDVAPATYLAISGKGEPGGDVFTASIAALYGMAYTIKMTRKFAGGRDYAVCKLEGLWWSDSSTCFAQLPRDQWQWLLCIRTPDFIIYEDLDKAAAVLRKRGKGEDVKRVTLATLAEGKCVQMLHVGPYDQEGRTIAIMQAFADKQGFELHGRHHEIYLSDPRRVAPEKLKTILRHPVKARAIARSCAG